jgi:hypothetical protein
MLVLALAHYRNQCCKWLYKNYLHHIPRHDRFLRQLIENATDEVKHSSLRVASSSVELVSPPVTVNSEFVGEEAIFGPDLVDLPSLPIATSLRQSFTPIGIQCLGCGFV